MPSLGDSSRGHDVRNEDEDGTNDVIALYLALFPQHAKRELRETFCSVSCFSLWLDWDEAEEKEDYPVSSGSSERRDRSVYLGKLIDWEERW